MFDRSTKDERKYNEYIIPQPGNMAGASTEYVWIYLPVFIKKIIMASVKNNPLLQGVSGKIGNAFIVKQYSYGTVISAIPDMSRIKKSKQQKQKRAVFAEAVAYAQSILHDSKKKAAYAKKIPKGKTVYHAAIQEFTRKHNKK